MLYWYLATSRVGDIQLGDILDGDNSGQLGDNSGQLGDNSGQIGDNLISQIGDNDRKRRQRDLNNGPNIFVWNDKIRRPLIIFIIISIGRFDRCCRRVDRCCRRPGCRRFDLSPSWMSPTRLVSDLTGCCDYNITFNNKQVLFSHYYSTGLLFNNEGYTYCNRYVH